ncbi:hypothetical protein AC249_AIPGENE15844 [Exaiptasia diaphana]|nr:hypothetical protein AC249_AIPGENE15844 [Exaiptasia diaphana]
MTVALRKPVKLEKRLKTVPLRKPVKLEKPRKTIQFRNPVKEKRSKTVAFQKSVEAEKPRKTVPPHKLIKEESLRKTIVRRESVNVKKRHAVHPRYHVFQLPTSKGKLNHLSPKSSHSLSEASSFILYLSLVCNFFIYVIFNDIYRVNIKALLQKCCCRSQANRKQEIPVEEKMTLDKLTD